MQSPLATADQLKQEADHLLFQRGIDTLLKEQGRIFYTGSYAFDLMAWPDIDLNLVPNSGSNPDQVAASLASTFVLWKEALRIKVERNLHERYPTLPHGLYLGLKLAIGNWQLPWKLDIWIVEAAECAKTEEKTSKITKLLTPASREKILDWKQKLLTPMGRTPSFSGYWLCQAILIHNLVDDEDILAFLREKGVVV